MPCQMWAFGGSVGFGVGAGVAVEAALADGAGLADGTGLADNAAEEADANATVAAIIAASNAGKV